MTPVLTATLSVTIIGLLIGIMLVFFGNKFAVTIDEKEIAIRNCLPGNNCGGCGYAGCDALAAAIASGKADIHACPVGGNRTAEQIGNVLGIESESLAKKVAYVQCSGDCDHALAGANYIGIQDCMSAEHSALNAKRCTWGCMGYGSCVKACPFDAIHIINGVAVVDRTACKACGRCVSVCPKHLITLIPDDAKYMVRCSSREKGAVVKKECTAGCIGCKLCEKQCESDAIHVDKNISRIDTEKCVGCGKCAEKCPVKVIQKRY